MVKLPNQGQLVVSSDEDSSGSLIANNQVGDLELTYERNIEMVTDGTISSPVRRTYCFRNLLIQMILE